MPISIAIYGSFAIILLAGVGFVNLLRKIFSKIDSKMQK
jgi:hypothetical protein